MQLPAMPHQLLAQRITQFYDDEVRSRYFRGLDFAGPQGDPGWFGPGSAVWHVHSHMPALVFGLQCAAYLERFDPSIFWMGVDHSRIVERDESGEPTMQVDPEGAAVRLGHSVSFFIATAYGSTATAERVAKTVRAMHHTVKGTRPDGLAYDADDVDMDEDGLVKPGTQVTDGDILVAAVARASWMAWTKPFTVATMRASSSHWRHKGTAAAASVAMMMSASSSSSSVRPRDCPPMGLHHRQPRPAPQPPIAP